MTVDTPALSPPPLLSPGAAVIEANRCLMCWDAPCIRACPTSIDVPGFIKKIAFGDDLGAARTILEPNPLGDSCAHACPTSVLCEGACVLNAMERKPIAIGRLQAYATAPVVRGGVQIFPPGPPTGHTIAVVGAGPAGLGCAAELVRRGHQVVVFDGADEAGGLNSHGVAEYKVARSDALTEIAWLEASGVTIERGVAVGRDKALDDLLDEYDAVFVGVGLGAIPPLGVPGENLDGVWEALTLIAAAKSGDVTVDHFAGQHVAVIGGGNTAIDAARLAVRLSAASVQLVYRRGEEHMPGYAHEIEGARREGVRLTTWAAPEAISGDGRVDALTVRHTAAGEPGPDGRPRVETTDRTSELHVDAVVMATGQGSRTDWLTDLLDLDDRGRIVVDRDHHTTHPSIWAGGDCVNGGKEVVNAVAEGVAAARNIDTVLARR